MQNTSLPKYRLLSSPLKAAYLPVTSYIFLTYEGDKKKKVVPCCPSCLILRFSEKKKIC